jgi:hypothetical protein
VADNNAGLPHDGATAPPLSSNTRQKTGIAEILLLKNQIRLWVNGLFLLALYKAISAKLEVNGQNKENQNTKVDANLLQYFPQFYDAAINQTKASAEALATARQRESKKQTMGYVLHFRYLHYLTEILRLMVESQPQFCIFRDFVLFFNFKNTKVQFMRGNRNDGIGQDSFPAVASDFKKRWQQTFDARFFKNDSVWMDVGMQMTAMDTDLSTKPSPDPCSPKGDAAPDFEAETYLWRECCLKSMMQNRKNWLRAYAEDARRTQAALAATGFKTKRKSGNKVYYAAPQIAWYPWAMINGVSNIILTLSPGGHEERSGLIYTQWYNFIKGFFDAQKHYAL